MHISAIVTIAGSAHDGQAEMLGAAAVSSSASVLGAPIAFWDVLGRSVLGRTVDRLRTAGISDISVVAEGAGTPFSLATGAFDEPSTATGFWPTWDRIVSRSLEQGAEMLLFVRLGTYAEFELSDLVRFHRETASSLTQVCDAHGALDLVLVDGDDLRRSSGTYRRRLSRMISGRRRFRFSGYCKRLTHVGDYRCLVQDALLGRCELRPIGTQVRPGLWIAPETNVDGAALVNGPAYIGANVRVHEGVTVSGGSNIEKHTEIDCGTTVQGCSVLSHTYVGVGLFLENAVIAGSKLFHLGRNIELEIEDGRLIGSKGNEVGSTSQILMRKATSLLPWTRAVGKLSTRLSGTASSMTAHRLED